MFALLIPNSSFLLDVMIIIDFNIKPESMYMYQYLIKDQGDHSSTLFLDHNSSCGLKSL